MLRAQLTSCAGVLGVAALALAIAGPARAVSIATSGIWSSPTGDASALATVTGEGTDTISWGTSVCEGCGQSSWNFTGVAADLGTDFTREIFKLGTFTHRNEPIYDFHFTGADLTINLQLLNGSLFTEDFVFTFAHNETLNSEPCDPVGSTICPDVVTIPLATALETLTIDGQVFELSILGFSTSPGGDLVSQFITEEGRQNTAMLYGSVRPIPEPSSAVLFGLGAFIVGVASRRKAAVSV